MEERTHAESILCNQEEGDGTAIYRSTVLHQLGSPESGRRLKKRPGCHQRRFWLLALRSKLMGIYAAGQEHATRSATGSLSRSQTPSSSTFVPVGYLNT